MHDSIPEPTHISPYLVECDFLSEKGSQTILEMVGSKTAGGGVIRAIIVDAYIYESHLEPSLSIEAMIDYGEGPWQSENIGKILPNDEITKATMAIISECPEIQQSMEYIAEKIPLMNIGKYLRCYFIGTTTVVSMEYLEGWLSSLGDDIFEFPDEISNRCQICTLALPYRKSAHEKMEQLSRTKNEWRDFKGAWPTILGGEFAERVEIEDPDLSVYPTPP